jgi:hypothetical protein
VHAEELEVLGGYQKLEHAVGVTGDLAAREFAISRHPDFVRDRILRQIYLGGPDVGHLGDGVDADRLQLGHA